MLKSLDYCLGQHYSKSVGILRAATDIPQGHPYCVHEFEDNTGCVWQLIIFSQIWKTTPQTVTMTIASQHSKYQLKYKVLVGILAKSFNVDQHCNLHIHKMSLSHHSDVKTMLHLAYSKSLIPLHQGVIIYMMIIQDIGERSNAHIVFMYVEIKKSPDLCKPWSLPVLEWNQT